MPRSATLPLIRTLCRKMRPLALLAWLCCAPFALGHESEPLPALDFEPPPPGSYKLYRIMAAPDGEVVGTDDRAQRLSRFTHDSVTLLGFIYTTCTDPDGCPLAYRVFDALKQKIVTAPALRGRVRFVTLSFDPVRDSPVVMRDYGGSRVSDEGGGLRWYFLTTRSARELTPLLEGFGQDIRYTIDRSTGKPRPELSHVLKVFLIDRAGFIREIYSSTFLHPQTVLNDIETLLMEEAAGTQAAGAAPAARREVQRLPR